MGWPRGTPDAPALLPILRLCRTPLKPRVESDRQPGLGEEGSLRTASALSRILRLASEPQDPAAVSLPTSSVPETRGQTRARYSLPLGPWRPGGRGGEGGSAQDGAGSALSGQTYLSVFSQDPLSHPRAPPWAPRPPSSLPRTVAPLQGPPFPGPLGLRPLQFCSMAQLPRTRLSLLGLPVPSGSLAARSLLLQVVFIGLSLGVGVLPFFHGNCRGPQKTRAASSCKGRTLWAC
ncbi:hypothetical protein HPG69_016490, partial [Diceros bicornis minor]